ncbi:hypothetical protein NST99_06170 [Paenibacillus sp. FSL L8-0470]
MSKNEAASPLTGYILALWGCGYLFQAGKAGVNGRYTQEIGFQRCRIHLY